MFLQQTLVDKTTVLSNHDLDDLELNITAHAALIFDDELMDFSTSSEESRGNLTSDFIQLFLYASFYYKKTNKYIKYLTIYNPLYSTEYTITITELDVNNILQIITSYEIGKKCKKYLLS